MTHLGLEETRKVGVTICGLHFAMHEKKNVITSFRASRFNNLFCAAATLIHHKDLITAFFQHRPPSNLKQGSVQADALCDKLSVMVLGLALMYVYNTGPFWFMINSGPVPVHPASLCLCATSRTTARNSSWRCGCCFT